MLDYLGEFGGCFEAVHAPEDGLVFEKDEGGDALDLVYLLEVFVLFDVDFDDGGLVDEGFFDVGENGDEPFAWVAPGGVEIDEHGAIGADEGVEILHGNGVFGVYSWMRFAGVPVAIGMFVILIFPQPPWTLMMFLNPFALRMEEAIMER